MPPRSLRPAVDERIDGVLSSRLSPQHHEYAKRRKLERLTRPMLVRYLAAIGVEVDQLAAYGAVGTVFESRNDFESRVLSVAQARKAYATDPRQVEPLG